jgi:hypothetical protein
MRSPPRCASGSQAHACKAFATRLRWLSIAALGVPVVPPLLQNTLPPLENNTTLVIQVLDLGLIVPLSFLSGALLLRRSAWGYLLASIAVLKFLTMGLAVRAMAINMALVGVAISPVELIVFPAITLVNLLMAGLLLKNIDAPYARRLPT